MPTTLSFRIVRSRISPRWLTDGEGGLVGYALDLVKDAFVERLRLGHLARFPQQDPSGTPAPPDALAAMGRDRRVVRGLNESDTSYAVRLRSWLDDRRTGGNAFTLMQKLAEYLGPLPKFRTVDNRGNWYTRDPDGTRTLLLNIDNWDWDGEATKWSRFWVIVYPNGLWTGARQFGDPGLTIGGLPEETIGSTAPPNVVQTVKFLVNDWKPAGARCVNIIIAFDEDSLDPTFGPEDVGMPGGEWGHWSVNDSGTQIPIRLDTALFWDGA